MAENRNVIKYSLWLQIDQLGFLDLFKKIINQLDI